MNTDPLRWAERSRPLAGEVESGDLHVVLPCPGGALLAVIDGLGHGPEAAAAARLAADVLRSSPARGPAEQIVSCHAALKGSRGAAMLVVSVSFHAPAVAWAGVGNIEGWQVSGGRREAMISRAGVVGYQISAPTERSRALAPGDLLLLASDGISPGFADMIVPDGDLGEMASAILSTQARASDDALVLIARYAPEEGHR
ncbi:MAG TPA: SpoIIE family protein phosphatase [Polyangia bacterium]|nr:SpoIIE family protein phosphatase [Polyangia bacterium]